MNTFKFPAFLCSVLALSGCRDYEPENLGISVFMHAYGDNFVAQVGQIAPEQSWDFSTAGGHRGQANRTRAVTLDDGVWYYPEQQTLDWMHDKLKEQRDNSGLCKEFYLSWTPGMSFQIVPIWEGYATMKWDLYMKVTPADGGTALYDQMIWSKGRNVQLKKQTGPNKTNMQYENDEVVIWFEMNEHNGNMYIWPWRQDVPNPHAGEYYTGSTDWGACAMTHAGTRNNHNIYKWVCSKEDMPTHVEFIADYNGDKHKVGGASYAFRNHGYYYENNPGYAGESDEHSPLSLYTPSEQWSDFGNSDNAANALGFRAKPINISDPNTGTNQAWPLGSIVSFYLKITGDAISNCANQGDKMSTLNKQIAFLNVPESAMPNNVDKGEGVVTGIMGCEDSHIGWDGSDKDYNDVVFLINGVMPEPVVIDQNPSASSVPVEKRYMAEDLTNTGDMDFNDIVVDVKSVRWTYWRVNRTTNEKEVDTDYDGTLNVNGQSLTFTKGICDVQTATVKHLCGTIPIRFKVGNTMLPWITNPTNLDQSKKQLKSESVTNLTYGTGSEKTDGIDPNVTLPVTGWDPKTNNVVVYVGWDGEKATEPDVNAQSPVTVSGTNWLATFPEKGSIPCIIATDVTDDWTEECVDITRTPWWKANFISTEH